RRGRRATPPPVTTCHGWPRRGRGHRLHAPAPPGRRRVAAPRHPRQALADPPHPAGRHGRAAARAGQIDHQRHHRIGRPNLRWGRPRRRRHRLRHRIRRPRSHAADDAARRGRRDRRAALGRRHRALFRGRRSRPSQLLLHRRPRRRRTSALHRRVRRPPRTHRQHPHRGATQQLPGVQRARLSATGPAPTGGVGLRPDRRRAGGDATYEGAATLTIAGAEHPVRVRLAGHLDPIDGHYHWQGTVFGAAALNETRTATLTVGERSAAARVVEQTPWGTHTVAGVGAPPYQLS
ncbi:DUF4873 domain-containing protein, partial [Mycobacterium interjectum]|nr:DUF4873 domain-containing protein [Mycobacterium interjectum]